MRKRTVGLCLVLLCAGASAQQKELRTGIDFRAPIVRAAVLGPDDLVLATHAELYRVRDGRAGLAARQEPESRLVLAPGGRLYAWVRVSGDAKRPVTEVQLHALDSQRGTLLRIEKAAGEAELILGTDGKLILFDLELAEQGRVALMGILHRSKETQRWPRASVIAMRTNGRVAFSKTFDVDDPTAGEPSIDIRGGDATFVAYTRDRLFTGRINGGTP